MHKAVWKFPLAEQIPMPRGAEVLHVGVQRIKPVIWALVDTRNPCELRHFAIVGTGWPLSKHFRAESYVGTWQDGPLVWHLFEIPEPTVAVGLRITVGPITSQL